MFQDLNSPAQFQALCRCLEANSTLKHLDLRSNLMGMAGVQAGHGYAWLISVFFCGAKSRDYKSYFTLADLFVVQGFWFYGAFLPQQKGPNLRRIDLRLRPGLQPVDAKKLHIDGVAAGIS